MLGDLSEMNIAEIDALLALIDHCVEEANEYIAYLEGKV